MGKIAKLLLVMLIPLILLSIPNVTADETNDAEITGDLGGPVPQENPERPTVLPDLSISPEDIEYYYERIEEEVIVIINATITNYGFIGAYAYVEFYDGMIDSENIIGSGSIFVKSRDTNVLTVYWKTTYGHYDIHVLIKDSIPRELIKRNNHAENTVVVSDPEPQDGSSNGGGGENTDDSLGIANIAVENPAVSTGVAASCLLFLFAVANKHYMWLANLGAIPLYSRITNGQVLKQDTRRNIYDYISSNPGAYFSSIMKDLKLKNGVTAYHLAMLEREGYIKSQYMGLYRRYYVNGASTGEFPQSKIRREIIEVIVNNPGISQTKIASHLGVSNQVVNYHTRILKEANFIKIVKDGYRTKCFISSV
jgi:DNA-binding MarR family transcriptional regulator